MESSNGLLAEFECSQDEGDFLVVDESSRPGFLDVGVQEDGHLSWMNLSPEDAMGLAAVLVRAVHGDPQ